MPTPEELRAEKQQKRQAEWGTYVATEPIFIDGVRAFNEGHDVPASHVQRGVVDTSQVAKVSNAPKVTEAAPQAAAEKKDA